MGRTLFAHLLLLFVMLAVTVVMQPTEYLASAAGINCDLAPAFCGYVRPAIPDDQPPRTAESSEVVDCARQHNG